MKNYTQEELRLLDKYPHLFEQVTSVLKLAQWYLTIYLIAFAIYLTVLIISIP